MNRQTTQLSREEQAKIEVGHTAIRPVTAWLLTTAFLFVIAAVPLIQQASDVRGYLAGRRASIWPQCYDFFRQLPSTLFPPIRTHSGIVSRVFKANRRVLREIHSYEDTLEDESLVGKILRQPAQYVLARWLGAGNKQAYCGRGHWLFYRPDIDYLIGPGFLNASWLSHRVASVDEWITPPQPDPCKAIIHFNKQLASRGITLIVMPTPVKPMIQAGNFARAYDDWPVPLRNPSHAQFVKKLEHAGILVFDIAVELANARRANRQSQYLATDSHWRPEAVELTAKCLKTFIDKRVSLSDVTGFSLSTQRVPITHLGDIAAMLKLPAHQTYYPKEQVSIRQILARNNEFWRPDSFADILVLGDSFSNVYSLEALGWGESAGLIEQLSFELQRPLDRIVQNDNGAYATRAILSRELGRGRDRLAGKRVVIYQFACRELTDGDWKIIDLSLGTPPSARFIVPESGTELIVRGLVKAVSPVPRPRTVPYKDHIFSLHIVDIECEKEHIKNGQAIVYMWSMKDNIWTPAARYRLGDSITVRLKAWADVAYQFEGINRSETDDDSLLLQEPCWGAACPP